MHYVHSILLAQGIVFAMPSDGSCRISQVFKVDDCELMQFTGVLDANGVKIWEGDILTYTWEEEDEQGEVQQCEDHIEVYFQHGCFFYQDLPLYDSYGVTAGGNFDLPVIANKWQQPFLLSSTLETV